MRLSELLLDCSERLTGSFKDAEIREIVLDSRKVVGGELFVALKGRTADGVSYIHDAIHRGAAAIMVESAVQPAGDIPDAVALVSVTGLREVLARCSARFYGFPSRRMKMVGITGTNGKTTTAHYIRYLAARCGKKAGTIGTLGCRFPGYEGSVDCTTPEPPDLHRWLAEMASNDVELCAMEVSSHALSWHRVDTIAFDAAIFTNCTQDHLDFHGDMHSYLGAKKRLFSMLKRDDSGKGIAIINREDPAYEAILQEVPEGCETISYGFDDRADVFAKAIELHMDNTRFQIDGCLGKQVVHLPVPGKHNVLNALAAMVAVVSLFHEPVEKVSRYMAMVPPVPGRMEAVTLGQAFQVIVDYAHTPDALDNLLRSLRSIVPGRLITVFGCGGDRDRRKRPEMAGVVTRIGDVAVLTSDNPRSESPEDIIRDMIPGIEKGAEYIVIPDRRNAIRHAIGMAAPGDAVVIAGKGHETYQTIRGRNYPFSDVEVAKEALRGLGFGSEG